MIGESSTEHFEIYVWHGKHWRTTCLIATFTSKYLLCYLLNGSSLTSQPIAIWILELP